MSLHKIAVVGPESTGKSELSNDLADRYHTEWVPEMAREYLNQLGRNYVFDDLSIIAKRQLEAEDRAAAQAHRFLFCDTNLLVIKVWSDFKYGLTAPWIVEEIANRKYDLHLLCNIDLPWQEDPLREHPHQRKKLFAIYQKELTDLGVEYRIVSGMGEVRLLNAVAGIEKSSFQ